MKPIKFDWDKVEQDFKHEYISDLTLHLLECEIQIEKTMAKILQLEEDMYTFSDRRTELSNKIKQLQGK
jgi:hypothetical protein